MPTPNSSTTTTEQSLELSRRDRKKAQRRQEIFDCSIELFVQAGYDNVTIDDIVDAVDIAKGTFFNYFPSKADVLVEYWRNLVDEVYSFGEKQVGDSGRALFKSFFRKLVRSVRRDGAIYEILVYQAFGHPAEIVPEKEWKERRKQLYQKYVKAGQDCGEIPSCLDAGLVGDMTFDLWTGTMLEWVYGGKNFSLEAKMLKKLDLLFDGFEARSTPPASKQPDGS